MNRLLLRNAILSVSVGAMSLVGKAQTLYTFPGTGFGPVYNFIDSATKTLDMTMYELIDTTAEQDLVALVKKGVVVRVILDQNLERSKNTAAFTFLTANGVQCHWADAIYAATHQKTITVDGKTSLILTANLVTLDYPTTRDFAITDSKAADVAEIEAVFNADFVDAAITPTIAASLIWSPNLAQAALVSLIDSAKHTLMVENEEMGSTAIVTALSNRAKAGVAVTVIMTNTANTYQTEFMALTKAGVKVFTYPNNATALYIHAKAIVVDEGLTGEDAYVGSINFSTASMTKNRELGQTTQVSTVLASLSATLVSDAKGGTLWIKTKKLKARKRKQGIAVPAPAV